MRPPISPPCPILTSSRRWCSFARPPSSTTTDRRSRSQFIAEYPFDTSRAIISLIFNGAFQRHRHVRCELAYSGGTIPMLRPWLTALAEAATGNSVYPRQR
jgi:hypothetical protein